MLEALTKVYGVIAIYSFIGAVLFLLLGRLVKLDIVKKYLDALKNAIRGNIPAGVLLIVSTITGSIALFSALVPYFTRQF